MECTFAINSTAPGFVLIQDEHSQYTINTTLQRHEGDVSKGSVNITDLPTGEYNVTVYDEMKDYQNDNSPAYVHPQPIPIFEPVATSSSPVSSSVPGSCNNYTSCKLTITCMCIIISCVL